MALRQEGGLAGLELVPDLAVGLPELSADRKTYTFVLRRGIKYSDGTEVVPDDVRHGFERLFTVTADGTDHPPYFANLLGAGACPYGCPGPAAWRAGWRPIPGRTRSGST